MKEVALHDAKNRLSALIAEIEESGEEIVITRHGRPAVRLAPVQPADDREARVAVGAALVERMEMLGASDPRTAEALPWEELKRESDEDRL